MKQTTEKNNKVVNSVRQALASMDRRLTGLDSAMTGLKEISSRHVGDIRNMMEDLNILKNKIGKHYIMQILEVIGLTVFLFYQ